MAVLLDEAEKIIRSNRESARSFDQSKSDEQESVAMQDEEKTPEQRLVDLIEDCMEDPEKMEKLDEFLKQIEADFELDPKEVSEFKAVVEIEVETQKAAQSNTLDDIMPGKDWSSGVKEDLEKITHDIDDANKASPSGEKNEQQQDQQQNKGR